MLAIEHNARFPSCQRILLEELSQCDRRAV